MSGEAKKQYLIAIKDRYRHASKAERKIILDEFCHVCGYHRKYAIRLLAVSARGKPKHPPRPSGRPKIYTHRELPDVLGLLWKYADYPCAKRLHAIIPIWVPMFSDHFHYRLDPELQQQLLAISPATIDRLLAPKRISAAKRRCLTTKPGSLLKEQIPIRTNQWDERRPGYLETDTVAHCGSTTAGMYVLTVNTVDLATMWSEQRAIWGKGERGVLDAIKNIEASLPFPLRGFDCDNGSEFINHHLLKHFTNRRIPVSYTRSRSYHKNDNAHIEERNYTRTRQYFGYDRFDQKSMTAQLNAIYTTEWRDFFNFYVPSMKLQSKERIGSKIKKRYDTPQTPYQRIMQSPDMSAARKKRLTAYKNTLNPFTLHEAMQKKINAFLRLIH